MTLRFGVVPSQFIQQDKHDSTRKYACASNPLLHRHTDSLKILVLLSKTISHGIPNLISCVTHTQACGYNGDTQNLCSTHSVHTCVLSYTLSLVVRWQSFNIFPSIYISSIHTGGRVCVCILDCTTFFWLFNKITGGDTIQQQHNNKCSEEAQ